MPLQTKDKSSSLHALKQNILQSKMNVIYLVYSSRECDVLNTTYKTSTNGIINKQLLHQRI